MNDNGYKYQIAILTLIREQLDESLHVLTNKILSSRQMKKFFGYRIVAIDNNPIEIIEALSGLESLKKSINDAIEELKRNG